MVMMRLVGYVEEAESGELRGVWLNLETGQRGCSRDLDNFTSEQVNAMWAAKEPAA